MLPFLACTHATLALGILVVQAPAPAVSQAFPCTLQLQGELKHRQTEEGVKIYSEETFDYTLSGTLLETTSAEGAVLFEFQANPRPNDKGKVKLRYHSSTLRGGAVEDISLEGKVFQGSSTIRFQAQSRGQAVTAMGSFYVGGRARITEASPTGTRQYEEERFILSQPLPDFGPGKPAIQFTGNALWALRNAPHGTVVSGTLTYAKETGPRTAVGRVEVKFTTFR